MDQPVLRWDRLTVTATDSVVLENLEGEILPGEVVGITGRSGCGKSTLARISCGWIPSGLRLTDGACRTRGRIALIPQEPALDLNPYRRVGAQALDVAATSAIGSAAQWALVRSTFDDLGLGGQEQLADSYPHELSGGQQQRVVWARALLRCPQLLIADEPTASLDCVAQRRLIDDVLPSLRARGAAVLWISHDPYLLAAVADRVLEMRAGRLRAWVKPASLPA